MDIGLQEDIRSKKIKRVIMTIIAVVILIAGALAAGADYLFNLFTITNFYIGLYSVFGVVALVLLVLRFRMYEVREREVTGHALLIDQYSYKSFYGWILTIYMNDKFEQIKIDHSEFPEYVEVINTGKNTVVYENRYKYKDEDNRKLVSRKLQKIKLHKDFFNQKNH